MPSAGAMPARPKNAAKPMAAASRVLGFWRGFLIRYLLGGRFNIEQFAMNAWYQQVGEQNSIFFRAA
jgi:hypothetical protein